MESVFLSLFRQMCKMYRKVHSVINQVSLSRIIATLFENRLSLDFNVHSKTNQLYKFFLSNQSIALSELYNLSIIFNQIIKFAIMTTD